MELRRALLLFAIVLGLAAIAASMSRPAADERPDAASVPPPPEPGTATARASPAPARPVEIFLEADLQPETRTLPAGRAAIFTVIAYEPGEAEIERLGLTAPAQADTPARFDLLVGSPGRYPVTFTPVATGKQRKIGVIEVEG